MRREALLILGVIGVAAAVLIALGGRTSARTRRDLEIGRLQRVYVALSLYAEQCDGNPAPSLAVIRPFLGTDRDLGSPSDPYLRASGPYPIDGGLPNGPRTSPVRISDAYLWAHKAAGRIRTVTPSLAQADPTLGLLADEWWGTVRPTQNYNAQVGGAFLRVTMDGAARWVNRGASEELGDAPALFGSASAR